MEKVYNLEFRSSRNTLGIITALRMCAPPFIKTEEHLDKWVASCYKDRAIACNPNHPRYREMIEALDKFGVTVFDAELMKIPDVKQIVSNQRCYT